MSAYTPAARYHTWPASPKYDVRPLPLGKFSFFTAHRRARQRDRSFASPQVPSGERSTARLTPLSDLSCLRAVSTGLPRRGRQRHRFPVQRRALRRRQERRERRERRQLGIERVDEAPNALEQHRALRSYLRSEQLLEQAWARTGRRPLVTPVDSRLLRRPLLVRLAVVREMALRSVPAVASQVVVAIARPLTLRQT